MTLGVLDFAARSVFAASDLVSAGAHRSLHEIARTLTVGPGGKAPPRRELLLHGELHRLIDEVAADFGLFVDKVSVEDPEGRLYDHYQLPTSNGLAALLGLPGAKLAGTDDQVDSASADDRQTKRNAPAHHISADELALVGTLLRDRVDALHLFTDATELAPVIRVNGPASLKGQYRFREVTLFDGQYVEYLRAAEPAERRNVLATALFLDATPPAIALKPYDAKRLEDLLLSRALEPVDAVPVLNDWVERLHADISLKGRLKPLIKGSDLGLVTRELYRLIELKTYDRGHDLRSYTVLGRLLEVVHESCGEEQRAQIVGLVVRYGLIRDRAVVDRLRQGGGVH